MSIYFDSITERRFYSRTEPTRPLYVPFGGNNLAMLLNLSENGLLVSTPSGLELNSVFRLALRLNGLPKPIDVHVRTVWTNENTKRAGVQLLDLSDHDREQIRKWCAMESTRAIEEAARQSEALPVKEEPATPQPTAFVGLAPFAEPSAFAEPPVSAEPDFAYEDPVAPDHAADGDRNPATQPPVEGSQPERPMVAAVSKFPAARTSVVARSRRKSAAPAIVAWGAVVAVVCLGAALFMDKGLAKQLLGRPASSAAQVTQASLPQAGSPVGKVERSVPSEARPATQNKTSSHRDAISSEDDSDISASEPVTNKNKTNRDAGNNSDASKRDAGASASPRGADEPLATDTANNSKSSAVSSPAPAPSTPNSSSTVGTSSPTDSALNKPAANSSAAPAPSASAPSSATNSAQSATPSTSSTNPPPLNSGVPSNAGDFTASNSGSSAIVGSIGSESPNGSAPRSNAAWPPGSPVAAGKTRNSLFHSRAADAPSPSSPSPVVQMDVNPQPVMAITPPRGIGSSYVNIPGERVIEAAGMTLHIRRAVRVPNEHWIWRGHKQVAMGELASRVDPQPVHQPAVGSITVQATVDKEGRVSDLKPLNGSFSFLPGVARAVREWRYEPTYFDGKPVETRAEIEIDFHMSSAANHP